MYIYLSVEAITRFGQHFAKNLKDIRIFGHQRKQILFLNMCPNIVFLVTNKVFDDLSADLKPLMKLKKLYITEWHLELNNQFQEYVSERAPNLKTLRLSVYPNNKTNLDLSRSLSNVEELSLESFNITQSAIDSLIQSMPSLKRLSFENCFEGTKSEGILESLSRLRSLTHLTIDDIHFGVNEEQIIAFIDNCQKLLYLNLKTKCLISTKTVDKLISIAINRSEDYITFVYYFYERPYISKSLIKFQDLLRNRKIPRNLLIKF